MSSEGPSPSPRQLDALIEATAADEIMVTTNVHAHAARLRSYELVAGIAGLEGRSVPLPTGVSASSLLA